MVERTDLYAIPAPIAEKLERALPEINVFLQCEPDFPHQTWHAQAVTRDCLYAANVLDLGSEETELAKQIAENHDEGYRLVTAGILKPEEHHIGSYLIALFKYSDPVVATGALLHNQEVMPEGAPFAYCLVRDIDRLHSMGWGGVIRAACYLGFRPFGTAGRGTGAGYPAALLENRTPDQARVKTQIRVNYCTPASVTELVTQTDYEQRAKRYSWIQIFPFLYRNGKLDELERLCGYRSLTWCEGEYVSAEMIYAIEPIDELLQGIFGAKIFNTHDARWAIKAWRKLHPQGTPQERHLERQWARQTYWHP